MIESFDYVKCPISYGSSSWPFIDFFDDIKIRKFGKTIGFTYPCDNSPYQVTLTDDQRQKIIDVLNEALDLYMKGSNVIWSMDPVYKTLLKIDKLIAEMELDFGD